MPTATDNILRKSFYGETKVLDAAHGLVECIFSVTGNLDRQNDVLEPGCFSKALKRHKALPVVYAHQWDQLDAVLGKTVTMAELMPGDPGLPASLKTAGCGGLKATVKFDLETPAGRLAFTHVKNENLTEWSFAFQVADDGAEFDTKGVRHVKPAGIDELFEASLVLIGANPGTVTVGCKSFEPDDAGYDEAVDRVTRSHDRIEQAFDAAQAYKTELTATPDTKGSPLPVLQGDEARHSDSYLAARGAINELIAQEIAEDSAEYDCVIWLAQIGQALDAWATQENAEYDVPGEFGTYDGTTNLAADAAAAERKSDAPTQSEEIPEAAGEAATTEPDEAAVMAAQAALAEAYVRAGLPAFEANNVTANNEPDGDLAALLALLPRPITDPIVDAA